VQVRRLSLPHSPCLLDPIAYPALGPRHPAFHVSIDAIAAGALLIKPVDTYHEVMNRTLRHSELPRFQAIPEEIETTPDSADKGLVRVFLQPQKPLAVRNKFFNQPPVQARRKFKHLSSLLTFTLLKICGSFVECGCPTWNCVISLTALARKFARTQKCVKVAPLGFRMWPLNAPERYRVKIKGLRIEGFGDQFLNS